MNEMTEAEYATWLDGFAILGHEERGEPLVLVDNPAGDENAEHGSNTEEEMHHAD